MRTVEFLLDKMPNYYLNKLEKTMALNHVYISDSTILREPKQKMFAPYKNTHTHSFNYV